MQRVNRGVSLEVCGIEGKQVGYTVRLHASYSTSVPDLPAQHSVVAHQCIPSCEDIGRLHQQAMNGDKFLYCCLSVIN